MKYEHLPPITAMVQLVLDANPQRHPDTLDRRILKVLEEAGELVQAFLQVTGHNEKGKTWADVREEGIDTVVVLLDVVLTPMIDQPILSDDERREQIIEIFSILDLPERGIDAERLLDFYRLEVPRFIREFNKRRWWTLRYIGLDMARTALAMVLGEMPDQRDLSELQRAEQLYALMVVKLTKWNSNRSEAKAA